MADRPLVRVGVDVGKAAHHACAMDAAGKVVFSRKVANNQAAIEQLVARAGHAASEVRWAIDLISNAAALLMAVLVASGQQVVYVPGRGGQPDGWDVPQRGQVRRQRRPGDHRDCLDAE